MFQEAPAKSGRGSSRVKALYKFPFGAVRPGSRLESPGAKREYERTKGKT
jgi:hypothetical protein